MFQLLLDLKHLSNEWWSNLATTIGWASLVQLLFAHSAFSALFRNPFIWVASVIVISLQLLAIYVSPLAQVLGLARPSESDWLIVSLCLVAPVVMLELTKRASGGRERRSRLAL